MLGFLLNNGVHEAADLLKTQLDPMIDSSVVG